MPVVAAAGTKGANEWKFKLRAREKETDRQRKGERQRQRQRETMCVAVLEAIDYTRGEQVAQDPQHLTDAATTDIRSTDRPLDGRLE